MKKYLKIILIIILMGFIFPCQAEEKNPAEKKDRSKLLIRISKMISELDISSAGTPSFSKQSKK